MWGNFFCDLSGSDVQTLHNKAFHAENSSGTEQRTDLLRHTNKNRAVLGCSIFHPNTALFLRAVLG